MASDMDNVDKIDNYVVNSIIYNNYNSNNEVRGCTLIPSANSFYSILYSFSNKSKKLYMDQIQRESNSMVQNKPTVSSDSIQLKYKTQEVQNPTISKIANTTPNMRTQRRHNAAPTYVNPAAAIIPMVNNSDIINIQLNYDINWLLDSDSWDGDFKAISLHGSMEHLGSNIKMIKELLSRIEKHILGKIINSSKANDIKDFEGLDKMVWEFISALYLSQ